MKELIYEELDRNGYTYIKPFYINDDGSAIEIWVYDDFKTIHLTFIKTWVQRQGYGTKIMEFLTNIADKYGYTMKLTIDSRFGTPKKVLRKFYGKFGFVQSSNDKDKYIRKPK